MQSDKLINAIDDQIESLVKDKERFMKRLIELIEFQLLRKNSN